MIQTAMSCLARPTAALAVIAVFMAAPVVAQPNPVPPIPPRLDVPYVPTPNEVVERMLDLAGVTAQDYVIDLGSGDGRTVIAAAKRGARAFGVDIDPRRIAEANENAVAAGVTDKASFREQNLFDTRIGEASVLTMYLLSRVNLDLRPRILTEMKPGSRVVSHAFNMGEWKPDRSEMVSGRNVYFWLVPAPVEGRWRVEAGERSFDLELKQEFQQISGNASIDGKAVPIGDGALKGAEIAFTLAGADGSLVYSGVVDGDRIRSAPGTTPSWTATRLP